MRNATRNITTAIMLVSLSFGVIGIPLYQHICAEMGVAELFSTCTMHERETHDFSCCSERSSQPTKQKFDGVECCYEIDATKQVTDHFTSSSYDLASTLVASHTLAPGLFHSPLFTLRTSLEDPSPPGERTYILHSSLLI